MLPFAFSLQSCFPAPPHPPFHGFPAQASSSRRQATSSSGSVDPFVATDDREGNEGGAKGFGAVANPSHKGKKEARSKGRKTRWAWVTLCIFEARHPVVKVGLEGHQKEKRRFGPPPILTYTKLLFGSALLQGTHQVKRDSQGATELSLPSFLPSFLSKPTQLSDRFWVSFEKEGSCSMNSEKGNGGAFLERKSTKHKG